MQRKELEKMLKDQLSRHNWNFRHQPPPFKQAGLKQWKAIQQTKSTLLSIGATPEEIAVIHNEYAPLGFEVTI